MKIQIIAPDSFSGQAFDNAIRKHGLETLYKVYTIPARVIGDKISESSNIVNSLNGIFRNLYGNYKIVAIACNTLQLWIDKIDPKYRQQFNIVTTFKSCDWKFNDYSKKPLWLGTTPLVKNITQFPTLISMGLPEVQGLAQELIWRIKMYGDNDISTATEAVKSDVNLSKEDQFSKIEALQKEIIASINSLGIKDVILGCTEYPIVFKDNENYGFNVHNSADILAEYILASENSVKLN